MSIDEADTWWEQSPQKSFNFDDEDQGDSSNAFSSKLNSTSSNPGISSTSSGSTIKTVENVLAASSSNEPFLRPSMIMCNGHKVEKLIQFLDRTVSSQQVTSQRRDARTYISEIVEKRLPIDFSPFKSKRDKLLLLDCSICCSDGNLITAATIFMSKTLKESIFVEELRRRPIATDHYLNYLDMTGRTAEYTHLTELLFKEPN